MGWNFDPILRLFRHCEFQAERKISEKRTQKKFSLQIILWGVFKVFKNSRVFEWLQELSFTYEAFAAIGGKSFHSVLKLKYIHHKELWIGHISPFCSITHLMNIHIDLCLRA